MEHCETCRKILYPTRTLADRNAKRIRHEQRRGKHCRALRIYECPAGGGFHLTKMPPLPVFSWKRPKRRRETYAEGE